MVSTPGVVGPCSSPKFLSRKTTPVSKATRKTSRSSNKRSARKTELLSPPEGDVMRGGRGDEDEDLEGEDVDDNEVVELRKSSQNQQLAPEENPLVQKLNDSFIESQVS